MLCRRSSVAALALAGTLVVGVPACSAKTREIPPVGETLIGVDTDLPLGRLAGRLQIDLYAPDGAWYASRNVAMGRAIDWPTSFGVALPDDGAEKTVTVRLRVYPEGKVRDYRGERYQPPTAAGDPLAEAPEPAPTDAPRLRDDAGNDLTPATEPQPLLTVDRLVRVRVAPSTRARIDVILRGACLGTMADVAGGRTCIDTERALAPTPEAEGVSASTPAPATVLGTFGGERPCAAPLRAAGTAADNTPLFDEEVCVPGALFVFGSGDGVFANAPDLPERAAVVDPFRMDKYEVTVARWRKALADGFVSPPGGPTANDGPIPTTATDYLSPKVCSYSAAPQGRETFALTCIEWAAARAFCKYLGGDLPTEVQWEYAAVVAGRPFRSRFPWGGDDELKPDCNRAVWGRGELAQNGQDCVSRGFGPLVVDARSGANGDVAPGTSALDLGGGVTEWTRDVFTTLTSSCWVGAGLTNPSCLVDTAPQHVVRGGSWRDNVAGLLSANRRYDQGPTSSTGFRCTRPGAP